MYVNVIISTRVQFLRLTLTDKAHIYIHIYMIIA